MRASPRAIFRLRHEKSVCARLLALLTLCLLVTACPATGGDLLPLSQGNEGSLESVSFKNDTLQLMRNQVTLRARGSWSASDSNTSLTLEIGNASAKDIAIAFDDCEMMNNESRERLSLRSVAEYKEGNVPSFISERNVTIESNRTKKYDLNFYVKPADGRSSVSKNVEGQTVTLRVPVAVMNETTAPAVFLFSFKYVEYQH